MSARRYVLSSTPRNVSPWITWGTGVFCLILLAILITFLNQVRGPTRLTIDASNLRQIGQAAIIYAEDNEGRLPENNLGPDGMPAEGEITTVHRYAIALARHVGVNDISLFISASDEHSRVHSDWREWSDIAIIRRDPDGLIYTARHQVFGKHTPPALRLVPPSEEGNELEDGRRENPKT